MVYDIASKKFDHPELNIRIEDFCMRYRLTSTDIHSTQLVVEELLNLLPLDKGLRLVIAKSEQGLEANATLRDTDCPCLPRARGNQGRPQLYHHRGHVQLY